MKKPAGLSLALLLVLFMLLSCTSNFFIQKNKYNLFKFITNEFDNLALELNLNTVQKEKLTLFKKNIELAVKGNQIKLDDIFADMSKELNKNNCDIQKVMIMFEKTDAVWSDARKKFQESFVEFYSSLDEGQKIKMNKGLNRRLTFIDNFISF